MRRRLARLLINGLSQELKEYKEPLQAPWYRRLMPNVNRYNSLNKRPGRSD